MSPYRQRQALARKLVNNSEKLQRAPVIGSVEHKIVSPNMMAMLCLAP